MQPSSQAEVRRILDECRELSPAKARVCIFNFVRDIPYGDIGSRDPFEVLKAKKGTCSGKHALLKLLLEGLGYEVQSFFAKHDFSKFPLLPWPEELCEFQSVVLTDFHDFLKVKIDGKWVTIDAIFDRPLRKFGFPVQDWNGRSDMRLPITAGEIFPAEKDVEAHKKRLLGELPEVVRFKRKEFLSALTIWLDGLR